MTPQDLLATLSRLGLSQSGAAALLGVSRGAVTRWVQGKREIPQPVVRLLAVLSLEIVEVRGLLEKMAEKKRHPPQNTC